MGAAHEYFYSHDVPKVGRQRNLCLHTPLMPFGYSPDEIPRWHSSELETYSL